MKKLLLILLCLPFIGFRQNTKSDYIPEFPTRDIDELFVDWYNSEKVKTFYIETQNWINKNPKGEKQIEYYYRMSF